MKFPREKWGHFSLHVFVFYIAMCLQDPSQALCNKGIHEYLSVKSKGSRRDLINS